MSTERFVATAESGSGESETRAVFGRLRPTRRPTSSSEDGATLVEFAMVIPILLLILIGIAEIGLYFKNFLTVSYASREGARVAAFAGDSADADCQILTALGEMLGTADLDSVERVDIFVATQAGNQTAGATNTATLKDGGDPSVCHEPSEPEDGWFRTVALPATSRQVTAGGDPLDIIGVRIVFTHGWATGFPPFSGTASIDETTIMRLEPEAFE